MKENPDEASEVVESIFGSLCVYSEVEKSNGETNEIQDVMTVLLHKGSDNQLGDLTTLPNLRRPEFFHGKLNDNTGTQVKAAVTASRHCRDMCEEWANHVYSSGDNGLQINDKILKWCQKEFFCEDSERPKAEQATRSPKIDGNDDRVAPKIDASAGESSINPSLGHRLKRIFFCGFKPTEQKKEKGPDGKEAQIFVKKLNGTIFSVNINADKPNVDEKVLTGPNLILKETVSVLKRKIHQEKGIPPDLQFLVFENTNLEDDKSLHDCGILPQSTIHLIQLRSVLGVENTVTVTARAGRGIEFKEEKFSGLYRWYRDGQSRPDVYMGEFLNGMLHAVWEYSLP
jgi:hypothetical protein